MSQINTPGFHLPAVSFTAPSLWPWSYTLLSATAGFLSEKSAKLLTAGPNKTNKKSLGSGKLDTFYENSSGIFFVSSWYRKNS